MSDLAKPLADMITDIAKLDPARFAGAFVIIPPSGEPISAMLTDPQKSGAAFWAMVQSKIEIAVEEFRGKHPQPGQFRR